jgi:hypothetical protein
MLYLDINEDKTLAFEVEINGVGCDEMDGHVRFTYEDIQYGFPTVIEEGKITAIIKPLKDIFPNIKNGTVVNAKLELNTETYYFVPWEGEIKVQAPISVEAKIVDDALRKSVGVKAKVVNEEKAIAPKKKTTRPPKKQVIQEIGSRDTWTKNKLKNIKEEDMIEYMKRSGTKNPQIQQILLQEARQNIKKGGELEVFKYIVNTLNKKSK